MKGYVPNSYEYKQERRNEALQALKRAKELEKQQLKNKQEKY